MERFDASFKSYLEEGAALPVSLLVQFERATGRYEITFEDSDSSRWAVSPANIKSIREELRPAFG